MGTAPIATRGNPVLELAEKLRQCRALRFSEPGSDRHGVPINLIDETILMLVELGSAAGRVSPADVARFIEAWTDA